MEFPELYATIQAAIESLGGAVFPKLNWSAPRDASWMMYVFMVVVVVLQSRIIVCVICDGLHSNPRWVPSSMWCLFVFASFFQVQ